MASFLLPVRKRNKNDININTMDELGNEYINYLEANNCSIYTIKGYRQKINRFIAYLNLANITNLKSINEKIIDYYKTC